MDNCAHNNFQYKSKYLKYKKKYLNLLKQVGGVNPSNASIILISRGRILCVREMSGKWTLPGGKIETDERPFHAAKREFYEETGNMLPDLRLEDKTFNKYDYVHRNSSITRIYIGHTDTPDLHFIIENTNGETNALKYLTLDEIMSGEYDFHNYIINSLSKIFPNKN
jgi:8-oxo-dGTP pyrophosphatase MutT (NUDIX family)